MFYFRAKNGISISNIGRYHVVLTVTITYASFYIECQYSLQNEGNREKMYRPIVNSIHLFFSPFNSQCKKFKNGNKRRDECREHFINVKFSFSEKATKMCAICLMVLTFTN